MWRQPTTRPQAAADLVEFVHGNLFDRLRLFAITVSRSLVGHFGAGKRNMSRLESHVLGIGRLDTAFLDRGCHLVYTQFGTAQLCQKFRERDGLKGERKIERESEKGEREVRGRVNPKPDRKVEESKEGGFGRETKQVPQTEGK